jgi:VIT1/CCC1 family predicted Fe2+/Mn2+ transporter
MQRIELHTVGRTDWLRAAVLGANDGIVSTSSLVLGVAAADGSRAAVLTAGVAGLVAGTLSMAAGEYVSVSSQRDAELSDLERERRELAEDPETELEELAGIYEERGLPPGLARRVAEELSTGDRLAVHARDELGIVERRMANPLQAAWASAVAFSAGAAMPVISIATLPGAARIAVTAGITLAALAVLGDLGARLGGAPRRRATLRVLFWGALAMAVTAGIGALVGAVV